MPKRGYVYLLASKPHGTLYIGVTSDLVKRVWQHRHNQVEGFTKRYSIHRLVYYEVYDDIRNALTREKRLKKWRRGWKIELIEADNPQWSDLYEHLAESPGSPLSRG